MLVSLAQQYNPSEPWIQSSCETDTPAILECSFDISRTPGWRCIHVHIRRNLDPVIAHRRGPRSKQEGMLINMQYPIFVDVFDPVRRLSYDISTPRAVKRTNSEPGAMSVRSRFLDLGEQLYGYDAEWHNSVF